MGYFRILAAIPGFFLSALLLMWLWNANAQKLLADLPDIDYGQSMLMTIIVWLVVAPLAAVGKKWW